MIERPAVHGETTFRTGTLQAAGQRVQFLSLRRDSQFRMKGPTVLLIHGMGNASSIWKPLMREWPLDIPLVAVDIPGHGGSTANGIRVRINTVAGVIESFTRRYLASPTVIVGHSLGSVIALEVARQAPDQVMSCLLLSGPPVPMMHLYAHPFGTAMSDLRPIRQLAQMTLAGAIPGRNRLVQRRSRTQNSMQKLLRHQVANVDLLSESSMRDVLENLGRGKIVATSIGGFGYDYLAAYSTIPTPCVAVVGQRDASVDIDDVRPFMETVIPKGRVEDWPDIGHLPMVEDTARTISVLMELLRI